jgi:hypothetical protein
VGERLLLHVVEEDDELGIDYHLTVRRSSMGAPGGFVEISRVEHGQDEDTLAIYVPDLRTFQPILDWANGGPAPRNVEITRA